MAKRENDDVMPEKHTWGTWEELLLACAVHRHGTESWTSVSAEIQKRSPSLSSLTASACRHKYFDLKRRFTTSPESNAEISTVTWLEELRRLRVVELRREVEQYDLSISSLQSKVKRLEEEREMMSSDLDKKELRRESDLNPPDLVNREEEVAGAIDGGEAKVTGEDSCRGSCESVEKESERVEAGRVIELTETEGKEETSDVQSSASLPRKGTTDQSQSAKDFGVESQPSISFVEMLLSQPCGSHFSRRLDTQETPEYGKIIRQHIDFEIIRKRDEEGWYKSSMNKLFRDLLLLITNAKVFYHKGSSEFNSAEQLHQLVKKQMTTTTTLKRPREKISPPKEKSLELVSFKEAVAVSSKPIMSVPIIACRKRSSLAAKTPLVSPSGADKKSKKTDQVVDDEKVGSGKDESSGKDDDSLVLKKLVRGKTSSARKLGSKTKGQVSNEIDKTDEEKKGNKNGSSKKKSVANFLKRMKGGSSSSDTVVETVRPSSEQRKNNINKADTKKRAATTTVEKNQTNEKGSPVKKKNNGRALKREAAAPSSPVLAKRIKEAGEKKEASSSSPSSTRSKKRVRR